MTPNNILRKIKEQSDVIRVRTEQMIEEKERIITLHRMCVLIRFLLKIFKTEIFHGGYGRDGGAQIDRRQRFSASKICGLENFTSWVNHS